MNKRRPNDRMQQYMDEQAEAAALFAKFMMVAVNRKFPIVITVEVDGVECRSGTILPGGAMPEYLANWACAQQHIRKELAEHFRKHGNMDIGIIPGERPSKNAGPQIAPEGL